MCCGKKKNFSPKTSGSFQSMSVDSNYVLMEFIGTGSVKKYRVPDANRVYYAGGSRDKKFFQVHTEDVEYFLGIKNNRIQQFKVREDFIYKPNQETENEPEAVAENFSLDEEEFFYENRHPQFEGVKLTDINNIGTASEKKLNAVGITTVDQLAELSLQKLIEITGLPEHKAKNVLEQLEDVQLQEKKDS